MGETDIKRGIVKSLRACGCVVLRIQAGAFRGAGGHHVAGAEKGTPDILVLSRGGVATFLEVKTDEGDVSSIQRDWHARAESLGHRVRVVRSISEAVKAVANR